MTNDELRRECEVLLLSDEIGCSYVHNMALDALIRFARRQQAVAWKEMADKFDKCVGSWRCKDIHDFCEATATELEQETP